VELAQSCCRLLWREVALRLGEHLVTDHEFFDRCGAQERWIEVGMKLPVLEDLVTEGGSMPAHRIGKIAVEECVVPACEIGEYLCQRIAL